MSEEEIKEGGGANCLILGSASGSSGSLSLNSDVGLHHIYTTQISLKCGGGANHIMVPHTLESLGGGGHGPLPSCSSNKLIGIKML